MDHATTAAVESRPHTDFAQMTAEIVSAYVSNNSVPTAELPTLIASIHASLGGLGTAAAAPAEPEKKEPAVSIKKSISNEYIVCLEDGKKFKSLKRHLATAYDMTPDQYRAKWNLPRDYPMVAPGYSATRSELAKAAGLGNNTRAAANAGKPAATTAKAPKRERKKAA